MQPNMNPIAQSLAGQGRYGDSMLVHMNPQEVAGLQALAMRQGGSLTVNPKTGLPEAFNLESILPMVAGAALTPVLGPAGAALAVGGLGTLMSGSIEQGLVMGLGAYGGANMAGSFANLAAPAADVTAAAAAGSGEFAAQQALAHQAAQQAAVQQATAMNLPGGAPTDVFGNVLGIDEMAVAGGQGVSAGLPANVPTLPKPPVSGIGKLFQPDERTTYENIGAGMKNVFSSGENAMKFLGDNKMNLAMSAAPMLLSPEEEVEIERQRAMIRPYEYQVDNLSGTAVDPYGTEAERLRGRFVAKTPYYAAQGGLMSFAEGGSTSTTTAAAAPTSNAEANVMARIAAMQQAAGMPMMAPSAGLTALPNMFTMAPSAPVTPIAYTPSAVGTSPVLDTSEKRYTTAPPVTSPSDKQEEEKKGPTVAEMFRVLHPNETPRTVFPVNQAMAIRARYENLAKSNPQSFSYDPATGVYTKKLAEGGSTGTTAAPAAPTHTLTPSQSEVFRNIAAVQQMMSAPVVPVSPVAGLTALPNMFTTSPVAYTPSMVTTAPVLDTSEKRYLGSPVNNVVMQNAAQQDRVYDPEPYVNPSSTESLFATVAPGAYGGKLARVMRPSLVGTSRPKTISGAVSSNRFSYDPATGTYKQLAEGGSVSSFDKGGIASLRENDFILPADVISHMGNGSSDAGMEIAITQFKARPIKGAGDGMSDSIPTDIEGKQKALVAHEEALIPREMVAFLGGGSVEKGAAKLEKFMDRVRKARTGKKKQAPEIDVARYMPA